MSLKLHGLMRLLTEQPRVQRQRAQKRQQQVQTLLQIQLLTLLRLVQQTKVSQELLQASQVLGLM